MPLYHYKAKNQEGRDLEGEREAKDQYELARILRGDGILPIFVIESGLGSWRQKKSLNEYLPQIFQRISLEEKLNFTRNTAVMIGAGVGFVKAFEVMARQTKNQKFKKTILEMADSIKKGKTFAETLGNYQEVFPKFYQEMVKAGEKSGQLEESLKLVAMQLKKDYALRRKVRSAMVYPVIILIAMVGIGVLMMIYVVPTLVSTFKELNVELPASTKLIIFISESILKSGIIILAAAAGIFYAALKYFRSDSGRKALAWLFTKTPVISGINQKFNSARTCRTLSSLISSGVDILEALSITEGVIQNRFYQNVLEDAKGKIQEGKTISSAFLSYDGIYPPLVGEMIAIGEETGELSKMLLRLAAFYESEVAAATKDLSTIIEPVLMIFIGIVVGYFAIAMISPMYSLVGSFG